MMMGVPCTIYSHCREVSPDQSGAGNLLKVLKDSRTLMFNGTTPNDTTVFYRNKKRKYSKFWIKIEGQRYGICVSNRTIILKKNDASDFEVKQMSEYVTIKVKDEDLYLTVAKPKPFSQDKPFPALCTWNENVDKKEMEFLINRIKPKRFFTYLFGRSSVTRLSAVCPDGATEPHNNNNNNKDYVHPEDESQRSMQYVSGI